MTTQYRYTEIPDYDRERPRRFFDPGRKLIKAIRDYQQGPPLVRKLAVVRHAFWSVVSGASIPLNTQIGGGFVMLHTQGIVIHPDTIIGNNCMICQNVTLGTSGGPGAPVLGHGVFVGANSVVVGKVIVPQNTQVGALSLVRKTLTKEKGRLWAGNPVKIQGE